MGLHLTLSLGPGGGSGVPIVFDPDAEILFAAMVPEPDQGRKIIINNLILALKADGIWTLLDILYVFAAHAQQPGTLNWKNPATFTATPASSPVFTVDRGFNGNAAGFLAPGWTLSADGVQAQQDSTHVAGWSLTAGAASSSEVIAGTATGGPPNLAITPRAGGDLFAAQVNDGTISTLANANRDGFFVANRSAAGARQGYRNGASLGSDTQASTAEPAGATTFLRNGGTTAPSLQIACGSVGASLNAGQVSDYYDDLLAYMQGVLAPVPTAPILDWTSPPSDDTPEFNIDFDATVAVGDVVTLQYDDNSGFPSPAEASDTLDSGEVSTGNINMMLGALGAGDYFARANISRAGILTSAWSNTEPFTIESSAAVINYVGRNSNGTNGTSFTFNAEPIGAAATGRLIVLCVFGSASGGSPDITTVPTIDGNNMTLVDKQSGAGATGIVAAIYKFQLDAGTTANFVLTFTETVGRAGIVVFNITGANTTETDTASNAAVGVTSLATSSTLTVPASGVGIVFGVQFNANASTWTGGSVTDAGSPPSLTVEASTTMISGLYSAAGTNTPQFGWTGSTTAKMVSAAWGP